jgi:dCTP diphosphatase
MRVFVGGKVSIKEYQQDLSAFVEDRGWSEFQNPVNLTLALVGEVGELAEMIQWKSPEEARAKMKDENFKQEFSHEVVDILNYLLRLSECCGFDIMDAAREKLALNIAKYPADKVYGKAIKYTEIE